MKYTLKDFQQDAVSDLGKQLREMQERVSSSRQNMATALSAPTGSGKTVMAAAVIEGLFFGDETSCLEADPNAVVLWVSDSPSLNEQTSYRFWKASDKLSLMGELQTIGSDFCAGNSQLEARTVYFLNKQMLSRNASLVRGGEGSNGRTFWDVLRNTIENPDRHLYLFIDEAHRGLGSVQGNSRENHTIYANLIDGTQSSPAAPIVVGISATPDRFLRFMENQKGRSMRPMVVIDPREVQESGLLKDIVELRLPEEGDPVEHQYLDLAAARLVESERKWRQYCAEQDKPAVLPLMVVQVTDRVSAEELKVLADQLMRKIPELNPTTSFAHVFGDRTGNYSTRNLHIPYIRPEVVEDHPEVRVLFAKEAISNGWDCPRAEVLYSQRRRHDQTYIAQLVGRMVRTPLGYRIEGDDFLNSVYCYLPFFDPQHTQAVVDYLTGKTDELGSPYVADVLAHPVNALPIGAIAAMADEIEARNETADEGDKEDDNTLFDMDADEETSLGSSGGADEADGGDVTPSDVPASHGAAEPRPAIHGTPVRENPAAVYEHPVHKVVQDHKTKEKVVVVFTKEEMDGIEAAFATLRRRSRQKKKTENNFRVLFDTLSLLAKTKLDTQADGRETLAFCHRLNGAITSYPEDFARQRTAIEIAEMQVVTINRMDKDNPVAITTESPRNDDHGIRKLLELAHTRFTKALCNAYQRHMYTKEQTDFRESSILLAAAVRTGPVYEDMDQWARKVATGYIDQHQRDRSLLHDEDRSRFDKLMDSTATVHDLPVEWPKSVIKDNDFTQYERHIIYNPATGTMPLDLGQWEQLVVRTEMARDNTIAFYRNPSDNSRSVFSFPIVVDGNYMSCRPDFVFFARDREGTIRPYIVDPHGDYLADTLAKLKGYVNFLQDYPDMFMQVLVVSGVRGGSMRALDLLDKDTQDAIMDFTGSHPEELFTGPHGMDY